MAGRSGSPIAVKAEEQSQSVVFTYFQGDISTMVDEHFTRALSKTSKTKSPSGKSKKSRKSVKSEDANSCQWSVPSWSDGPITGRLQLNAKEPHSSLPLALSSPDNAPRPWSFAPRQGGGLGLTPMTYSHVMSPEGLSVTGQQYTNSLLNLLHSDRAEVASGSKPDLLPSWTGHPGFRDPMNPAAMGLDSGIVPEKKDLYWY